MHFRCITDSERRPQVNWQSILAYCAMYKPGTVMDWHITRRKKKRSDPMRKYYYSCVLPAFLKAYYYEPEDRYAVHTRLKILYFGVEPDKHGVYRTKDIPAVFADDSHHDVSVKKAFTDWVIRKCAESDNPQYVENPR